MSDLRSLTTPIRPKSKRKKGKPYPCGLTRKRWSGWHQHSSKNTWSNTWKSTRKRQALEILSLSLAMHALQHLLHINTALWNPSRRRSSKAVRRSLRHFSSTRSFLLTVYSLLTQWAHSTLTEWKWVTIKRPILVWAFPLSSWCSASINLSRSSTERSHQLQSSTGVWSFPSPFNS